MNLPERHPRGVVWLLPLIFLFPATLFSQGFQTQRLNNGPLYGTASVLQDYDEDGDMDVIVTRRSATYEPAPSSVELLENDGAGNFSRHSLISEGLIYPVDIDYGDFDSDGNIDYLVCESNSASGPGSLAIFWNEGNGAFTRNMLEDSTTFDQAATADFDGDGFLDFVAVGFGRSSAVAYLQRGARGFEDFVVADSLTQVSLVEADDVDGNGDTDIIIGGGVFRLFYNDGNAGFDSTRSLRTYDNYNSSGGGIAIADLNNDGAKDILAFARVGFGGLYFLDGANDYEDSEIDRDGIDLGGDLMVLDIDGNGLKDIVRQNAPDSYIAVLFQDSTMKFRREILERYWDNRGAGQMSVGDLDGDEDLDLFLAENGNIDGDVSWYENINGKLYRHTLFGEIQSINSVRAGDIDGDGDQDLVVAAGSDLPGAGAQENEVFWYENLGNGQMREWRIDDNVRYPGDLELEYLDENLAVDVVATANVDSALILYRYSRPEWTKMLIDSALAPPLGLNLFPRSSPIGARIVLSEGGADRVTEYGSSNGGGSWSDWYFHYVPKPVRAEIARFNNDDWHDLVIVSGDTMHSVTSVLSTTDQNSPYRYNPVVVGHIGSDVEVGDWDRDGNTDIIASFDRGQGVSNKPDVAFLKNDGNGEFSGSALYQAHERTRTIKLIDIDNDDDLDLIVGGNSVTVNDGFQLLINEADTVGSIINLSNVTVDIYGIDAADLDGDGVVEIIAADRDSRSVLVLRGGVGTDVRQVDGTEVPTSYALLQNYPNPFNPRTVVSSQLPVASEVKLAVYDVLGREVAVLVNERRAAGTYHDTFDGTGLASGVYFYTLRAGTFMDTKKLLLVR